MPIPRPRPHPLLRVCLVAALVAAAAALAPPASADGGCHPHFDDGGTLTWYRSLDEAQRVAAQEGKVIFVDYGRARCTMCYVLATRVLTDPAVRAAMGRSAIGLASDCDRPERAVQALFSRHQPHARMLPLVAFLTPDGRYVTGFSGKATPDRLLVHLRKAEVALAAWRAAHAPAPAPTPAPLPVRPAPLARAAPEARGERAPDCGVPRPAPEAVPETPRERPVARPAAPRRAEIPPPALEGSPDACSVPRPARRIAPEDLPPPRVVINPPVRVDADDLPAGVGRPRTEVAQARSGPAANVHRVAEEAAAAGRWSEVLALAEDHPEDARLATLEGRAHAWAHARLAFAVQALGEERFEEALDAVEAVLVHMPGQPEAVDAERGLLAMRTMMELRYLDPRGAVAPAVRRRAYEEMRGSRWAELFS